MKQTDRFASSGGSNIGFSPCEMRPVRAAMRHVTHHNRLRRRLRIFALHPSELGPKSEQQFRVESRTIPAKNREKDALFQGGKPCGRNNRNRKFLSETGQAIGGLEDGMTGMRRCTGSEVRRIQEIESRPAPTQTPVAASQSRRSKTTWQSRPPNDHLSPDSGHLGNLGHVTKTSLFRRSSSLSPLEVHTGHAGRHTRRPS